MSEELRQPRTPEELHSFIEESLVVQDALLGGLARPGQPGTYVPSTDLPPLTAIVWVDMTKRPELTDLARLHRTEGEGEAVYTWVLTQDPPTGIVYLILHVNMRRPVRVAFRIRFAMPDEELVIEAIVQNGRIVVLEGPAPDWRELVKTSAEPQLVETLFQKGDVTLTLSGESRQSLQQLYTTWKAQFRS
jgi:hypothetical protein